MEERFLTGEEGHRILIDGSCPRDPGARVSHAWSCLSSLEYLGASQFACPAPTPNSGVMGHETQSVGHRTPRGCLSHSWVWWGGRGGRPCQGRTAELAIASAMLRLSSSAVSSHTGMSGQIHRFPDLSKIVFFPTHLVGKELQLPSPNPPLFSGPWYWVSIWCSL